MIYKKTILVLALCCIASPGFAENSMQHGEQLFKKQCTSCHGTELFSSPRAKITNKEDLRKRVNRCQLNTRAQWFDEDIDDVTLYLQQFYPSIKNTK